MRALLLAAFAIGCSAGPGEAGIPRDWPTTGGPQPSTEEPAYTRWDRMQPHEGIVLEHLTLRAVYVGEEGLDGPEPMDPFLAWVVRSQEYWTLLAQYGVGLGAFLGSTRVPTAGFFPPAVLAAGAISTGELRALVTDWAVAHGEGILDVSYIFFLPRSISISDASGEASCSEFGGYHSYLKSGVAFSIIPTCKEFPREMVVSHELAEMATDPTLQGYYSDAEAQEGGEIADLCNEPVSAAIDLHRPTKLWSNAQGACLPR